VKCVTKGLTRQRSIQGGGTGVQSRRAPPCRQSQQQSCLPRLTQTRQELQLPKRSLAPPLSQQAFSLLEPDAAFFANHDRMIIRLQPQIQALCSFSDVLFWSVVFTLATDRAEDGQEFPTFRRTSLLPAVFGCFDSETSYSRTSIPAASFVEIPTLWMKSFLDSARVASLACEIVSTAVPDISFPISCLEILLSSEGISLT